MVPHALAYDLPMRRLFLCFLLCLMPLRLWAGVWMPLSDNVAHHPPGSAQVSLVQTSEAAGAVHDCHEAMVGTLHEAQAQPQAPLDGAAHKADCHDGTCQLCSVCHQSASLQAWLQVVSVAQAHPLPPGGLMAPAGHTFAPLTKPPIS
jgi:hypothetical protein